VILSGNNFAGATAVTFGNIPASTFVVNSDSRITAVAPAQAGAAVHVTVTTVGGTSATSTNDQFIYNNAPVAVMAVSPNSGPAGGGTVVLVTGSAFTAATGVSFGLNAAPTYTVLTDGALVVTSPAGSGTVDVRVTVFNVMSPPNPPNDQFTYTSVGEGGGSGGSGSNKYGPPTGSGQVNVPADGGQVQVGATAWGPDGSSSPGAALGGTMAVAGNSLAPLAGTDLARAPAVAAPTPAPADPAPEVPNGSGIFAAGPAETGLDMVLAGLAADGWETALLSRHDGEPADGLALDGYFAATRP
jgi:hypothetical protein